jgi:hypothetical protein
MHTSHGRKQISSRTGAKLTIQDYKKRKKKEKTRSKQNEITFKNHSYDVHATDAYRESDEGHVGDRAATSRLAADAHHLAVAYRRASRRHVDPDPGILQVRLLRLLVRRQLQRYAVGVYDTNSH